MELKLITDGALLDKHITSTLRAYDTVHRNLHVAAVSAIHNLAKSGNPARLQRLYDGLRQNDQTALKLFIRRSNILVGVGGKDIEAMPTEQLNKAAIDGQVISFEKNLFVTAKGHTTPEAKALADLCEKRFINPDGTKDKYVFERNNIAEIKTLGDTEALKAIVQLGRFLENKENSVTKISSKVRKIIADAIEKAKAMQTQDELKAGEATATGRTAQVNA